MSKYALPRAVKELRFILGESGSLSDGLRSFVLRSYPTLRKHNPSVPILVREAQGVEPIVYARFGLGKESSVSVSGKTDKEIEKLIAQLVAQ
ncbi:hypothetical protein CANCADRAFT_27124 [Tortispora caseinolytica NRRL Y-17796]|uniref:Ribosomal protein/NADH dehydrogenase domain-containing protein n=1 Tax=Tortispora caseinolytica NRRL Y-17796 TaxID=767744 RepID=A0A1E4TCR5_9ASCO|nr:hypothetical protein CANCADRAFT_27124 [Tortispora caseinolytica NRRL Y-17796]